MKLMKKATALVLCFLMLTNGPISAFATESVSDNDVVVETSTTTETVEVCEECGGSDAHTETCSLNIIAPLTTETPTETAEPTETTGATVGETVWLKRGSCVYKNGNGQDSYFLTRSHEVLIKDVFTDEEKAVWYRIIFLSVGSDEGGLDRYKYVKAEDTSIEKPDDMTVDPHACDCKYPPESGNLADHVDSCPRKQYIKTLFEGKTVEEIYAAWGSYDQMTQSDLLNMLERWNPDVYEKLQDLLNGTSEPSQEVVIALEQLKAAKNRNEFEALFSNLSDEIKNQFTEEQLEILEQIREALPS